MKNKLSKRIISLLLVAFMMISFVPMTKLEASAAGFTPRYTAPSKSGWYANYNRNNCVDYARCRANEILGNTSSAAIFTGASGTINLGQYYYNAQRMGFSVGSQPKPGAVIVSSNHVAIVEAVTDSKIIWTEGCYNWVSSSGSTTFAIVLNGGNSSNPTNPGGAGTWFCRREVAYNKTTGKPNMGFSGTWFGYIYLVDDGVVSYPPIISNGNTQTGGNQTNTYYDSNAKYSVGEYKATASVGVNMRTGAGTNYSKLGKLVPCNGQIYITETNGNWGKGTYGGKTGWVCLDYFTKVSVPDATTPTITNISATNIAKGGLVTINWGASSNATRYAVSVNNGSEVDCGANTSYSLELSEAKTYTFKVRAYNSVNKGSSWSGSVSCVAHAPSTVTFVDDDGTIIDKMTVDYGKNASAPAPSKEGHTFQGWNGSTYNITKDVTLKAQYSVNTYNVKFWGADDNQLGETQKVKYGEDATPPEDTEAPEGYKFIRWSSEEYKNVFSKADDKTVNIYAIYEWANENIPITCEITEAYRDSDGYHVLYDIKNNVSSTQTGRAIISLKTAEGKLIYTTESKTFRLPGNSSKTNIDEFFECDETASVIEIIIVDSYKTGTPLSENVSKTVTDGLGWSNWQDGEAPPSVEAEERTVYRYRDKEYSTGNAKSKTGWTWDGTRKESAGSWSGYSDSYVSTFDNEQTRREVRTQTVPVYSTDWLYVYYHFYKAGGGNHTFCPTNHAGGTYHGIYYNYSPFNWKKYSDCGGTDMYTGLACPDCGATDYWWYNSGDSQYVTREVETKTQYSYRDITYTYNFWRWKDWSDWSTTSVTASSTRDVEEKTQYRTFNGVEDTSGDALTKKYYVGTEFAGKQVTLFVYKFDAASDYTDEFVGQTTIDKDGYCTFNVKLREEPSIQTGDFTFALGIEGTTSTFVVDTLEAPVPEYKVNFYDWDGNIVETQTVKEGENAVLPSYIPEKEGYDFVGWSDSLTNIRQDTDIFADMEKREYQVIFVDWENQLIEIQTFEHGDVLVTPEIAEIEGHTFAGWDKLLEGKVLVTSNMVVSTVYEANTYTVSFCDYEGNVIETQEVEYNDSAVVPDSPQKDGAIFAGWFNPEEYQYVDHDVSIFPAYYFEETCEIPEANYQSDEFSETIELTLSSDDENAVIYYYLNNNQDTEAIYTGPITIEKTTAVTYYATSLGKNDSEPVTSYYCINRDFTPSEWMLYSELPEKVTESPDEYIIEEAKGYRFMNTVSTGIVAETEEYVANGYTLKSSAYTDYTAWQDKEISVDKALTDFEVETREVEDTSKQRYKFTRYKYVDSGKTVYSYTEVEGFDCTLEETFLELKDPAANPVGFVDGNTSVFYWEINGEQWYNRKNVSGVKTQYRSRYKVETYYKWTEWDVVAPEYNETREYETDTVYRYDNKIHHLITLNNDGYNYIIVEEGKCIPEEKIQSMTGYDFVGLYTDEMYENKFSISTPITESLTLYPKYEPKVFTVTFQMEGGLELDSQQVKYMEAASAPDSFNIRGYVFGGWDKDFDCVTEDMVVTGKYFKEEEYARISLNNTVYDMYQGNDTVLTYSISPANLSGEAVEWSSSNPEIVSVDEKGKITALSPGEATITAMVTKTREKATCVVTVNEDVSNFIIVKAESSLNHDDLGYLRRIGFNTKTADAAKEFRNTNLLFFNIDGALLGANDAVGTGTVIKLMNGEKVLDSETVIVTGDMTGDGILNNRDVGMVNRYLVGKVEPQECQVLALDLNGDGYINNKDAAMAARYLVGKEAII